MMLLLRPSADATPITKPRGRTGVKNIVNLAPKNEKHDLAWWQQWLATHWG